MSLLALVCTLERRMPTDSYINKIARKRKLTVAESVCRSHVLLYFAEHWTVWSFCWQRIWKTVDV